VDIWAAGVVLFYLLVHEHPFKFKSSDEAAFKEEFNHKCSDGFRFNKEIEHTNYYAPPLKGNKNL
jgi:serine/threonine protein kinase